MNSRREELSITGNILVIIMCVAMAVAFSSCSGTDKRISIEIDGKMEVVDVTNFKRQLKKDRIYFCLEGECMYYNGPYIIRD